MTGTPLLQWCSGLLRGWCDSRVKCCVWLGGKQDIRLNRVMSSMLSPVLYASRGEASKREETKEEKPDPTTLKWSRRESSYPSYEDNTHTHTHDTLLLFCSALKNVKYSIIFPCTDVITFQMWPLLSRFKVTRFSYSTQIVDDQIELCHHY